MTTENLPVPVLEVHDLVRHYRLPRESLFAEPGHVFALNGVTFEIQKLRYCRGKRLRKVYARAQCHGA